MARVIKFEEVAKHKERDDCWLAIFGKVYDVTSFLEDHPGGDEVLLAVTEKDATEDFEDVGHSDSAKEMMEKYYIGDLDSTSVPPRKKYKPPQQVAHRPDDSGFALKIMQFLVPLLILGIAFALRFYGKKED
ncbi:cytochrome b5-like [Pistacia vera]|uniref:cytochrome b5-like n=1 Tax=Pistacia vera TaxID=55513 RepID=UPI0012630E43|nr:cytochrome b5-like [Pistacia vera]XP_031251083.1 cytochrome b5-like [Pistacia vera]XP_031251158.1 cytochrome b5-like [Pistacia vera]XP_031251159.1 cytochrome b5-like [Pistacia vera]XP_031283449.1 cytochrome b5-like [Pistacia vera]XP_031283450.1 cytochrome b5-like [Pistacia vera]